MDTVRDVVVGKVRRGIRCVGCGGSLVGVPILGYPHSGGEDVNGAKLWLYIECPNCGYQNSLKKLRASLYDISS